MLQKYWTKLKAAAKEWQAAHPQLFAALAVTAVVWLVYSMPVVAKEIPWPNQPIVYKTTF